MPTCLASIGAKSARWFARTIFFFGLVGNFTPVHAEPQLGECSGILHADRDSIIIGGGEGEGEGICIINKSQENTVLSKCRIGQFCRVKGVVDECKDSGECSEILRVTSAQRTEGQEQTATKTTLWYHNGSLVSLIADGPVRKFYYKEPREEMRAVHLPPVVVTALASLPRSLNRNDRVFRYHNGGRLRDMLDMATEAAGVELPRRTAFHVFRHNYATWMRLYGGLDGLGLVRTGAWADLESVERYAHSDTSAEARRANELPTPNGATGVQTGKSKA